MKILFIGDIVGKAGRKAIEGVLEEVAAEHEVDFIIANGENAAGGMGLTPSIALEILDEGVEVITCNEIEQAETALNTTYFDLVIADIRMSGVNGIEGLELLSYIKDRFDSKVIIMTGDDSDDTRNEAYRRDAHYYFQKPVDIPELLKQVSLAGIPVKNSCVVGSN